MTHARTPPLDCIVTTCRAELRSLVHAHSVFHYPPSTLDGIVSGLARDRLLVVSRAGTPLLVGCVLHDLENPDSASEIIPLACPAPEALGDALPSLLGAAERELMHVGARLIEVAVPPGLPGIAPCLAALGYERAWDNVDLVLEPPRPRRPLRHLLPAGAGWQDLDEATVEATYRCYARSFGTVPGSQTPPLAEFGPLMLSLVPKQRILVLDGRVLAFTRVGWKDEAAQVGDVLNLGRDPDAPLPGLGALTLAEAVRALVELGAVRVDVTASSRNLLGLGLYAGFGFREAQRRAVFHKRVG